MAQIGFGQSVTVNSPTDDVSWNVFGGSLTIAAGAQFPSQTIINVFMGGKLAITGGTVNASSRISVAQQSTATISGGEMNAGVMIAQSSKVTLSGGVIKEVQAWYLVQESTLTVEGSGLVLDDSNPFVWKVTGTLQDGNALTLVLQVASNQNVHVVLQNG